MTVWIAGISISLILVLVARRARKRRFSEYGFRQTRFELAKTGTVDYAEWLHPKCRSIELRQQDVDVWSEYVGIGDFVIDIGAYSGDTTVPMALAAGATGLTLAIEPNPHVFNVLQQNAALNGNKTNIVALNIAATDVDGTFVFHYSDASFCNGGYLSRLQSEKHHHRYELAVEGRNLSRLLASDYKDWLARLTLVKIDAEGYDSSILRSLADILRRFRPVIICEVYKHLVNEEREELLRVLDELGYDCFRLDSVHQLEVETARLESLADHRTFNILCKARTPTGRVLAA